jgi:1-acyl-sn-glycerol-3-phosphate acyltransferase
MMTESALPVSSFAAWRLIWRLPLLLLHLLIGIPLTLMSFLPGLRNLPAGGVKLHQRTHRLWSILMLRIFGIRIHITGQLPDGPCLIVANHISWMDIVLLHALWPMRLVAKAEIRDWPVIGALSAQAGTLFIRRGSEASRRRVNRRMAALLKRGERVGIFPEAGIRAEAGVGRFHARLFAAAIRSAVPVVPVAIRYDRDGDLHDVMVFRSGENFFVNLLRLLGQPACRGKLIIGPALVGLEGGRSVLARRSHEIVKSFYES